MWCVFLHISSKMLVAHTWHIYYGAHTESGQPQELDDIFIVSLLLHDLSAR